MSFVDQIPQHHQSLVSKRSETVIELQELRNQLNDDDDENARHHACDCEFCPYADYTPRPALSARQEKELKAQIKELESLEREYSSLIRNLIGYAKLWGVEIKT